MVGSSDAADGRHGRSHRPRQDVARARADGEGHRPPARGEGARDLDRPRLRAPRPPRRPAAVGRRRPGTRTLHPQHGRRCERHRPLPARDRRCGRRPAADARAPRHPATARDRERRRGGHEGRHGRRGDTRARGRGGARAGTRRGRRRREREDRRGPRRAARRAGRALRASVRTTAGPARLYVDRVFTLHGIGTVATGTLWSGSIGAGDELRAEPSGLELRVRSVEVHDAPVERAEAGQRVAVSLPGDRARALRRGDALVTPGAFRRATASTSCSSRSRRFRRAFSCTTEPARSSPAWPARARRYAQLRLSAPVVAARGDRFVLRTSTTVGGGRVLDPLPPRHSDPERMRAGRARRRWPRRSTRRCRSAASPTYSTPSPEGVEQVGRLALLGRVARGAAGGARPEDGRRRSARPGYTTARRSRGRRRSSRYSASSGEARSSIGLGPPASLDGREEEAAELEAAITAEGFGRIEDADLGAYLERAGRLFRVGDGFAVSPELYGRGRAAIRELSPITIASVRDRLGVSRRIAQLLLERFDADGLTRRVGDERVLRKAARA